MRIDHNVLALSPHDGDLANLPTMQVSLDEEEGPARGEEEPYHSHLSSTFVPMPVRGQTEQQKIQPISIFSTSALFHL